MITPEVRVLFGPSSRVTGNTAIAVAAMLSAEGDTLCILDLDVSPNRLTARLGLKTPPKVSGGRITVPQVSGIALLSPRLFGEAAARGWKGPVLRGAVWQMLHEASWPGPVNAVLPDGCSDTAAALAHAAPGCTVYALAGATVPDQFRDAVQPLGQVSEELAAIDDPTAIPAHVRTFQAFSPSALRPRDSCRVPA